MCCLQANKITQIAQNLIPGDKIHLGGGIRKASKKHGRVLNVEFLRVLQLAKNYLLVNPTCKKMQQKNEIKRQQTRI